MLTVTEAARRVGRDPETVRRWIRTGRLRCRRLGVQYVIEERDLELAVAGGESVPLPKPWGLTVTGGRHPDWAAIVRRSRAGH